MCARTLRSSRVQDTRGGSFARGIGGEILRGTGDHGDAGSGRKARAVQFRRPRWSSHGPDVRRIPAPMTTHFTSQRDPPGVKTNNSERFPIPAGIENPPASTPDQGISLLEADRGPHVHSGGKPADPVAIQFQNIAARLTTNATMSSTTLPMNLPHKSTISCGPQGNGPIYKSRNSWSPAKARIPDRKSVV